jgi:hypothetical protein
VVDGKTAIREGRYHWQYRTAHRQDVILNIKWRCSLIAMSRSPRRFCRHDRADPLSCPAIIFVRLGVLQPKIPGLIAGDDRYRPFGGHAQATPTGSRSGAPDNSQILRQIIFKTTAMRRGDFPPMCDNAAPTRPSPSVG